METGVGLIQEPVFTKTSTEEAPAGVLIDHSSMEQKEQIDTGPVKVEKSLNSDREETSIKSDEVKVEKDSITVETAPEDETATNGESVHDVETTKRVLFEPKEKDETEIVNTVVEDAKMINNEETTSHKSKSLRENAEPVEAEQITSEVTLDKEKDEDMTRKTEKVQESTPLIDTPTIQESEILKNLETKTDETDTKPSLYLKEDQKPSDPVQESITIIQREEMESIISPELKEEANQSCSKDTEEDEHVLERNIVPEAENLETKEDEKPIMDLKEDKEQEETKTVISSDEKEETPEEKHEKNQDNKPETVLAAEIESRDLVLKVDKEELKDDDDATKVDKVVEEQRGVESNDPEAEQIDGNKTEEIPTLPDVEPVEKMQNPSLESYSEVSEETSKTVDEKIEDKPNEQEKETQEVTNAQETLVEGKPDEVVQVSEEREDETVVGIGRNADMKANEDEQKVDIIQTSLETVETTQPHSSLLSSLEKQGHGTVAEAEKPTGDTEEHEHVLVRDIPQDDSLVTEAESVDTSTTVLETLETKEDTEPMMDLKEAKETHLLDEPCGESDKYQGNEADTSKTLDEATQHQEGEKEGCYGLETKSLSEPESSELGVKSQEEEESSLPNKQEKETCFQKEQIEKHEPTNEENIQVSSASPSAVEAEKIVNIKADEEKLKEDDIEESLSSSDEVNKAKDETSVNETAPEDDHQSEKAEAVEAIKKSDDAEKISRQVKEVQESPKVIEREDIESKDTEELEHVLVRDIPQSETVETEAVHHNPIDGEVKGQDTKEDLKADKEQEETETDVSFDIKDESQGREESVDVKPKEIVQDESSQEKDENVLDVPSGESAEEMKKPSYLEEVSKETSKTEDEKMEEIPKVEVTLHQESQEEEGSNGLETKEDTISEQTSTDLEVKALEEEEEPNEQEKETKLQKEETEKHEPTNEGQQTLVEEKSDELVQVSEERAGETVVGVQKIEDIKANEDEEKIQTSIETAEIVEPHTSMPSPRTLAEAARTDGTESTVLVAESEEEKPRQVKETEERKEVDDTKVDTIPQEPLSDDVPVQIQREDDDAIESHKELSKVEEAKETRVAQEEQQTRDIEASLTEKFSTDQTQLEEQVEGETKTKEPEDEYVDSSESFDNEPLIAETKKEDEAFENLEAPTKLEESKEDKSQENSETIEAIEATSETSEANQTPSFVSELEDQIPKQVEEIHEEETKEEAKSDQILPVETSQADQTPFAELVSEHDDQTPKEVKEIHEEEEAHKLQAEEILPTEITARESSDEALVSMLASKEDDQVTPQEGTSTTSEEKEESGNHEAPKLDESKEYKNQEISETTEPIEATGDQTLATETSEADQTPSFVSELDEKIPNQVEEIHEEAHKEEAKSDQNLPVEALHEHETPSSESVSGLEDQTPKQVEKIHEEEKIIPTEIVPRESITEAPASMLASQEDNQVLKPGEIIEEQDENSDDFTFSKETREAEHGDESSSTLPVVGILTQLQTTLENERAINDSASSEEKMITEATEQVQKTGYVEAESSKNDLHSIKEEPETLEKNHLVTDISEANKLQDDESGEIHEENGLEEKSLPIEENKQKEHKEEVKVPEEETREIVEQEERSGLQDLNAATAEKISLQEEHPRDFEISKKVGDVSDQVIESELPAESPQTEQKEESHETVKEEDQLVDIKEEKKNEEVQDEKIRDKEDTNALDFVPRDVEKEEAPHSVLENEEEIKEEGTSEKEITEPTSEYEKEHVENQAISESTKSNGDRDFLTEEGPKDQREEVSVDKSLTKEALGTQLQYPNPLLEEKDEETSFEVKKAQEDITKESANDLITDENVQDQPKNFETPVTDKETSEQEQKSSDHTYVQEDNGTNVKPEDVHDSVATQKEEICFKEEKREVGYVKTDAIKHEVSVEEKNNVPEETDLEATKEIYQEESKQTDIKEEQKETTPECLNSVKNNTDDTTEKSKPVIREIENLPSVSNTQDNPKQKDEVPVPKLENVKTTEELQQKDKESENIFSEETVQEPARKSLSSLIEKVEGTNKNEDTTAKPEIKEEAKTEEEDDKTSPDSIVMVEAKDTVSIIKTQHKKSQGILSGVGSKVKHSISKVKKVFTGGNKSSHTTN